MKTDIGKHLARLKRRIEAELAKHLPAGSERPSAIHKAMRYSVFSGGKRIRPIIAIESCGACGGNLRDVLPAACAIEMIHAYSLVHDDLPSMDDDDYRRGKPTLHRVFGEANAILAGDALLTLAFNVISKNIPVKTGLDIIKELSDAIGTKGMVGGQVLDLEFKRKKKDKKTLDRINRDKTARLFEASAGIGAIASGAANKKIAAMSRFGLSFGMAFQVVDDIIDREGYVKSSGIINARCSSERFIKDAKRALSAFGAEADRLREMADHLLTRKS